MQLASGIAVYFIIWWTVLFAVLPWGIHVPDQPDVKGGAHGAPSNPHLKKKLFWTTIISAFCWGAFYIIMKSGVVSFRG